MEVKENDLKSSLECFMGTENYYKMTFVTITDGIKYLCERAECYWLIDIVSSYQGMLTNANFQIWNLKTKDNKAIVTCKEDSDKPNLVKQEIPFTDFEDKAGFNEIEFYCIDRVCMLKAEY